MSRIYPELFEIKGTHLWSIFQISVVHVFLCWSLIIPDDTIFIQLFIYLLLDCTGFWASRVGPVDNSLEGLKDRLKMTLLYSKANGTVVAYNHAFCRWKQFANDRLNGKAFPAGPLQVALYLQHIIEGTHSPCSVNSAFYGLEWAHDVAGTASQLMIQLWKL